MSDTRVSPLEEGKGYGDVEDDRAINNPHYAGQPHLVQSDRLKRALSARQVQMIAIGGTIGTGSAVYSFAICCCTDLWT